VTAAAKANSVTPDIAIADYFVHAKNVRHFWLVLLMVCVQSLHMHVMLFVNKLSLEYFFPVFNV